MADIIEDTVTLVSNGVNLEVTTWNDGDMELELSDDDGGGCIRIYLNWHQVSRLQEMIVKQQETLKVVDNE